MHPKFVRGLGSDSIHIVQKLLVRQASFEGLLCKTRQTGDLKQGFASVGGCRPGPLLLEQDIDHRKELWFRRATRQHDGGCSARIERKLAQDEAHLAGVDVFFLERLIIILVKAGAMRAGHRHVFDDGDRSGLLAERHFLERALLHHLGHVDITIRLGSFNGNLGRRCSLRGCCGFGRSGGCCGCCSFGRRCSFGWRCRFISRRRGLRRLRRWNGCNRLRGSG